ncbi:hypothetical protein EIP86_004584 [Pleurotus ostreatoroseus]|nr:hypothetical protein EIP86_004584 [Pleurotus ostreatoroseus]
MDGGSSCPIHEHMKAATTIHFKCDTSVFGAGMLYNYFVLGLRGFDTIPRYSPFSFRDTVNFFQTCIGRVKERSGSLHLGSGGMGSWGGRSGGGYRGLAGSREEEAGMLSGPPGYLDEEDEEEEHHENPSQGMDSNGVIRL